MNKKQTDCRVAISPRYKNLFRMIENSSKSSNKSIPSLKEGKIIAHHLKRHHEWKIEKRKHALQQTFKENCRLFVNIQNQKSHYTHTEDKKNSVKKRILYILPQLKKSVEIRHQMTKNDIIFHESLNKNKKKNVKSEGKRKQKRKSIDVSLLEILKKEKNL